MGIFNKDKILSNYEESNVFDNLGKKLCTYHNRIIYPEKIYKNIPRQS